MSNPPQTYIKVLKKYFGHSEFRPMQWQIIRSIIEEKRDNCVVMATGYGKSLCYQFPPVYCEGVALVVSPLISLMQDQVLSLQVCNIPACYLGAAQVNKKSTLDDIFEGKYRLVYLTPEWAAGEYGKSFLANLKEKVNLVLVAIDEAHCVSQWGFDFRKSYRNLKAIRSAIPEVPFLTVTATATPEVIRDICINLMLKNPSIVKTSFDRPNLYLSVSAKGSDIASDLRLFLLKNSMKSNGTFASTIIYCTTKKTAERVCDSLSGCGLTCAMYHADLSYKLREEVHQQFVKDIIPIVVATVAFGMGIDKPDVRTVIHYGAPKEIESYYQEIGRAGRDGHPAVCQVFFSSADFTTNKFFLSSLSGRYRDHKEEMGRLMVNYLNSSSCRRKLLLTHFDPDVILEPNPRCCDNCLLRKDGHAAAEIYDLTEDTLLLLQTIELFNGKYGLSVPIYFLRGSTNKRLPQSYYNHALYGKGISKTESWWKCLGRLLLSENLLVEDSSSFGQGWNKNKFPVSTVSLTRQGQRFLRQGNGKGIVDLEATPEMMTMIKPKLRLTSDKWLNGALTDFANPVLPSASEDPEETRQKIQETEIYDKLTELRSELALKIDCMPYMICSTGVLQEMAKKKPIKVSELSRFNGFTETKIRKFGAEFIEVIKNVVEKKTTCSERSVVIGKKFQKFKAVNNKEKISLNAEASDWDNCDDDDMSFATALDHVEEALKTQDECFEINEGNCASLTEPSVTSFATCTEIKSINNLDKDEKKEDSPKLDKSVWEESDDEEIFLQAIQNEKDEFKDSIVSDISYQIDIPTCSKYHTAAESRPVSSNKETSYQSSIDKQKDQKRTIKFDSDDEDDLSNKKSSSKKSKIEQIIQTQSRKKFVKSKKLLI